jgi:phosphoglycolate phosphatase
MSKYSYALFDLDGTLTDPGEGITRSVQYALAKFGIDVQNRQELFCFIGPPLHESFEVYYGFSRPDAMKAVDAYREYYAVKGIFENLVYDGIEEMLAALQQNGIKICLATSKPEIYAKQILEHFGLDCYFTAVAGSEMDGTRTKKAEVVERALEMSVGEYEKVACSIGVCYIYKENVVSGAYDDEEDPFFSDFYSDASEYLYAEILDIIAPEVTVKDKFYEVDYSEIPKVSDFVILQWK